jgi:tetratricopeptide (TPR) repeat protein
METLFRLEAYEFGQAEELVMSRLNQWLRGEDITIHWDSESRLMELPSAWRELPGIATLPDENFLYEHDFAFLREAVWMRRIGEHVRAQFDRETANNDKPGKTEDTPQNTLVFVSDDKPAELRLAMQLFDWTIKNIQLEEDAWPQTSSHKLPRNWHTPYETVLLGRGTASDRAWVFILLARQQGLEVVMLGLGDSDNPADLKPWLPALVLPGGEASGQAPELYLFEPALGLPVPGPDWKGIATLSQAAEDETVLRQLDLDDERRYPVDAKDLQQLTALAEASPGYLSRRSKFLESKLAGHQRMTLSVSVDSIAKRLEGARYIRPTTRLWTRPFETYALRAGASREVTHAAAAELYPLEGLTRRVGESTAERKVITRREDSREWAEPQQRRDARARVRVPLGVGRMMQLAGNFHHETGALRYLQQALTSEPEQDEILQTILEGNADVEESRRAEFAKNIVREIRRSDQAAKVWIGQIKTEQGEYERAINYFTSWENPIWRTSIEYSLGRTYEATGELAKALQTYRESDSPQRHGNLLRARRLEKPSEQKSGDG